MQALLIISHGSRRSVSNNELLSLEKNLRLELADSYPIVESAFLEFFPQSIAKAINKCVEEGATTIKVLPYFLAAGVHVTDDIPSEVKLASEHYQSLNVDILPHIGSSEKITSVISSMLTTTEI
jgi:sirohydrochlorin ferrochelatase